MEQVLKHFTLEFFGKGKHKISIAAFFKLDNVVFLDIRTKEETDSLSVELKHHDNVHCMNIPTNEIPDRLAEIPKDNSIGIFCPANVRSAMVYGFLLSKKFSDVRILEGGYPALTEAVLPGKILQVVQAAELLKR